MSNNTDKHMQTDLSLLFTSAVKTIPTK